MKQQIEQLDQVEMGKLMTVHAITSSERAPEWAAWLQEIGFLPGERVQLMARAYPGGSPLVVRVGQSTFALRRSEAACVRVVAAQTDPVQAGLEW